MAVFFCFFLMLQTIHILILFVIYIPDVLSSELPLLFTDGRLGERAGGESSSELATVLMASW